MKLELVKYECARCTTQFEAPEVVAGSYGEFLLRSPAGSVMYLDALEDKTYEEVDRLLAANDKTRELSAFNRSEVLRRIYGEIACDTDDAGATFVLGAHPLCPDCGSQEMASWQSKEPPELVDVAIENVTHHGWNSLSEIEKRELLKRILRDGKSR
jgi:hypothetical protein